METLKEGEKVYGSVDIFNLIIDFTTDNRIANIEIKNVSEYLKSIDIDPKILQELTNAKISLQQMRGGFLLKVLLKHKNDVEKVPFSIPTEEELVITV